jgi:hypothetical protein
VVVNNGNAAIPPEDWQGWRVSAFEGIRVVA